MLIDLKSLRQIHEMIDVGVIHIGECTTETRKAYEGFGFKKIIWIQADPSLSNHSKVMIGENPIPNLIEVVLRLDEMSDERDSEGLIEMKDSRPPSLSGKSQHKNCSKGEVLNSEMLNPFVPLNTIFIQLDALLRKEPRGFEGVNLAILRIRGAEFQALNEFGRILEQLRWIYVEVNRREHCLGGISIRDIDYFLLQRGFFRCQTKFTSTGKGEAFYLRKPRPSLIYLIYYKIKRFIQYKIYSIRNQT